MTDIQYQVLQGVWNNIDKVKNNNTRIFIFLKEYREVNLEKFREGGMNYILNELRAEISGGLKDGTLIQHVWWHVVQDEHIKNIILISDLQYGVEYEGYFNGLNYSDRDDLNVHVYQLYIDSLAPWYWKNFMALFNNKMESTPKCLKERKIVYKDGRIEDAEIGSLKK